MSQKVVVVYGVCGSGKSTIGKRVAEAIHSPFFDADDFHPQENKDKMQKGIPLNDNDRMPWLNSLAELLKIHSQKQGAVLACSALKESYREILSKDNQVEWVLLHGNKEVLQSRMENRKGHFMAVSLLDSQLDTLELPTYGQLVNIDQSIENIEKEIIEGLK